jgi:hypothetical protein
VSDEFIVPLCRGHHREVHRSGDEALWWSKAGIDATGAARALWTQTHPFRPAMNETKTDIATPAIAAARDFGSSDRILGATKRGKNRKAKANSETRCP